MTRFEFEYKEQIHRLTDKERMFGLTYVRNGFNGRDAATVAGYSAKTATVTASKLLTDPHVRAYVEYLKENLAAQLEITAYDIAKELARIGFSDTKKLFNEEGNLKSIHDMDDDLVASINEIEVDVTEETIIKKVKRYDKVNALTKLARMIGAEGALKTAQVNNKGEDVPPAHNNTFINVNPQDLTDEQLEKIYKSKP